jgi:glycosyltransferase involved in cell wall biosynthesis
VNESPAALDPPTTGFGVPRVSVVIPVFNRLTAVCRAIESVLAQTCQDFEIVVVDDASTDGTAAAVAAIADPRVTLIRHERNRGGGAARNTGIQSGTTRFVAFLDSDDEWLPTKLARQLEVFERSGDDLGMVFTGAERILEDGTVSRHMPRAYDNIAQKLLTKNVVGGTSVGMIRREVFAAVGGFDESLPSGQDVDLWLRISQQFAVGFVPEMLVRIWQANDGGRISKNVEATVEGRERFFQKHKIALLRDGDPHVWFRDTGWVHHRYAGDAVSARRLYLKAIAAKPLSPGVYVLLLATYMPLSWLDGLARGKHAVTGWLRFGGETRVTEAGSQDPAEIRRSSGSAAS